MKREVCCLRCGAQMLFIKQEKLQLGQTGFFFGDWPNLLAGSLEVEIFGCHTCGKLEFFMPGFQEHEHDEAQIEEEDLPPESDQNIVGVSMAGIPQVRCPRCARKHDFDYPQCPHCEYPY